MKKIPRNLDLTSKCVISYNVLQEAIVYSVSTASSPFLVPIYQPRSGSSDVGTGADQEQPYEEERLKVEEGGLSIRTGIEFDLACEVLSIPVVDLPSYRLISGYQDDEWALQCGLGSKIWTGILTKRKGTR